MKDDILPLHGAGGMPIHKKYWSVIIQARKQQYRCQISAIAFLLRLNSMVISQSAWTMAKKSILWPTTLTDSRKQVCKGRRKNIV